MNKRSNVLNAWKNRLLTGLLLVLMVTLVALPQSVLAVGPLIGEDHPTTPGEVMLFKAVTPVPGMVNVWEVTLRMEALDVAEPTDIVLVIDRSGSMGGTKLANAKAAAKAFVNNLLDENRPDTRIAVVSFADGATTNLGLTNYTGKQALLDAINGLTAGGGTHTQAGVRQAGTILSGSGALNKHIVLLSGGEPTYSYALNNPDNYLSTQYIGEASPGEVSWRSTHDVYGNRRATTANAPAAAYRTTTVGQGTAMFHRYDNPPRTSNDKYYNHGNSAIAQARFAKGMLALADGDNDYLYTIALDAGTAGTAVLNSMASPGKNYATNDPGALTPIFTEIAEAIGSAAKAAKNASVNDPMGAGFVVDFGTITELDPSQGTASYDGTTRTISWNVGTLTEPVDPDNPLLKYAELTYQIEIDDSILNATPNDDLYSTNGNATASWTDVNDVVQTVGFPVPEVNPVLMIVEKQMLSHFGNTITDPARTFDIHVQNLTGTEDYDQHYDLTAGMRLVVTNLRDQGDYTAEEIVEPGTTGHTANDYDIVLTVGGVETNEFTVLSDEDADFTLLATNQEKPLGQLTVYKHFDPDGDGPLPAGGDGTTGPDFTIRVTGPTGWDETAGDYTYGPIGWDAVNQRPTYGDPNAVITLKAGGSLTMLNLPYGDYSVEEVVTNGFTPTYSTQPVTLSIAQKNGAITVTNAPEEGDTVTTAYARKLWQGGTPADDYHAVALTLLQNGSVWDADYVVTPTGTGQARYDYTWADLPKYDGNGAPYAYTVQEPGVQNYESLLSYDTESIPGETIHVYTNTYKATGTFTPMVSKRLVGRPLLEGEFRFELIPNEGAPANDADGTPIDEALLTQSNSAPNDEGIGFVCFPEMHFTYDDIGTHVYSIGELNDGLSHVDYDETIVDLTLVIEDNEDGTLNIVDTYSREGVMFNNTYIPDPSVIELVAHKELSGLTLGDGVFTFELLSSDDEVLQVVTNKADGTVPFNPIEFTSAGEGIILKVREKPGSDSLITYDGTVYTLTYNVMVDVENNVLVTELVRLARNGTELEDLGTPLAFRNVYTPPAPTPTPDPLYPTLRVPLKAGKTLKNAPLTAGQFTFQLKDARGSVLVEVQNAADGSITFPDRTFRREVSNYIYTINEKPGTDKAIAYDPTVYTVKVTTTARDDRLRARVNVEKDGVPYGGDILFTNERRMPATGDNTLWTIASVAGLAILLTGAAVFIGKRRKEQRP